MRVTQGGRFALLAAGAALALGSSASPPKPAQPRNNNGGNQNSALAGVRGTTSSGSTSSSSGSSSSSGGGNDLVTFEITMDDASDVMPVMRKAAKAYGCGTPKEEVDGGKKFFVVQCTESMLGVVQEGRKITFACEKVKLDEDGCKQMVRRYVEAASDKTAGNQSGTPGFGNKGGTAGFGTNNGSGSTNDNSGSNNSGSDNSGGKPGFGNTNTTEDGTQSYTIDLESDANVIPLFRDRLKKIGCEVPINAGNFIQASCNEGRVYVYQEKKKLTFNCEKMTSEQCGSILDRMQKAE